MTADTLLDRAAELKRQLVEYSQSGRYDRAFRQMVADLDDLVDERDEDRWMLLWDSFVLEHRLRNGRTIVEQFVDAHPELTPQDRELVLGWRDVVTGPFEVQRRDGAALILVNLVDDLVYRVRATAGPGVLRRMPKRSFLLTRLVRVGDEWMFSGPTSVLASAERDIAYRLALDISLQIPKAAYRNPERLARAWELQRAERQRFIRFFGSDLVVIPGREAQQRLDEFAAFSRKELLRELGSHRAGAPAIPEMALPADLVQAETVALVFDEEEGLGLSPEFGLVEEAFAEPELVRYRRYRQSVVAALNDPGLPPMALRRLADRDPVKASELFQRLLKRKGFDWTRDCEELLRSAKPAYYEQPHLPQITPVSDRLAAYARRGEGAQAPQVQSGRGRAGNGGSPR
jgi:hypothetical protein